MTVVPRRKESARTAQGGHKEVWRTFLQPPLRPAAYFSSYSRPSAPPMKMRPALRVPCLRVRPTAADLYAAA